MNIRNLLKTALLISTSIATFACSDQSSEIVAVGDRKNEVAFRNTSENVLNEDNASRHSLGVNESIVGAVLERLQINADLKFDEERHSSLTRFAEVIGQDSITQFESTVYIEKASIHGKAKVYVGLELAYQLEKYRDDRTNLTVIQNIMKNVGQGFIMTGRAMGCREGGCTVFDEVTIGEQDSEAARIVETRGKAHVVSLHWDDEYYRFVFSFNGVTSYIDMVTFASKYDFNPRDFSYARIFATIENIKNDHDEGRVVARFGSVNVNGSLYDDFSGEALNPEKWATGETFR